MKNNNQEAFIIGALLHDVGKFVQRARNNFQDKSHSAWGGEWFGIMRENPRLSVLMEQEELNIIASSIESHHNGYEYICLADAISAGMDRIEAAHEETGSNEPNAVRLTSIFSRVSLTPKKKSEQYHQLKPLFQEYLDELFPLPERSCTTADYRKLYDQFIIETQRLDFNGCNKIQVINQIYSLLLKYTWCIPSAVYRNEPDISLFDHLKTTAAITGCLCRYHAEKPEKKPDIGDKAFLLVEGDISGIQSFIFSALAHQRQIAKSLRARSFYIQIASDIASHIILDAADLPLCNVLSTAGGNFILLLPNTDSIKTKLVEIEKELQKKSFEEFGGELFPCMGWIEADGKDLKQFNETIVRLKDVTRAKKCRPFHQVLLDSDGKWDEPKFVINESITGEQGVCVLCKKHPVLEGKENCRQCEQEVRIGRVLTAARYIAFYHDVKNGYTVLGRSFEIWDKFQTRQEPYLIIELNNHSSARTMPRCMANHVPLGCDITCHEHQHEPETPVTFGCIAGAAHGEQRLGYMKADVDNMGLIFREGFLDKVPQGKFVIANIRPSISRFTALSRMVEYFFSGYLQQCLTKDYRDIYTVFSGGDDFFLIGPWDRLIDLASHQREKFRAYTAQNPDFSFSAGLITAKPDEPLSFTSHHAEAALVMAKAEYLKDHFSLFIKSAGITDLPLNLMDAVTKEKSATPLNKPVRWNEVTAIIGEARKLMQWIDQKQMTMGLVHNLWKYGTMYLEYDKTKDNRLLKAIPSLVYDIKRNVNGPDQQLARDWLNALVGSFGSSTGDGLWPYLRLIMDYALTYTRSGANAHKEM